MEVRILNESGFKEALLGLSLSRGLREDFESGKKDMAEVAFRLAPLDGGHNKFLESMIVWLDIKAPRYWWQQFDTYRVGTSKQSESTMHLITKRPLTKDDFEGGLDDHALEILNEFIETGSWLLVKRHLPEGYLQNRVVCTNYKSLRNMYQQRKNHRLKEWRIFLQSVLGGVRFPDFVTETVCRETEIVEKVVLEDAADLRGGVIEPEREE